MENQVAENASAFEPLSFQNSRSDSQFTQFSPQEITPNQTARTAPDTPQRPTGKASESGQESSDDEHAECASQTVADPQLLIDREGNRVIRIRVLCGCGKSIVLKCNYPETTEPLNSSDAPSIAAPVTLPHNAPAPNTAVAATA